MTRGGRGSRPTALVLVILGLACGDTPTAPDGGAESAVVSLTGIEAGDAGIVLRLTGGVDAIEATSAAIELAWVEDATHATTVAIVGSLSESRDVLLVRRQTSGAPLEVQVIEVASADGTVSSPSAARASVRTGDRP